MRILWREYCLFPKTSWQRNCINKQINNVFESDSTETGRHFQGIFFLYIFHFASYANAASLANILPGVLIEWSSNWPSFAVLFHRCSPFPLNSLPLLCYFMLSALFTSIFHPPSYSSLLSCFSEANRWFTKPHSSKRFSKYSFTQSISEIKEK
jgi:hypothetical protein